MQKLNLLKKKISFTENVEGNVPYWGRRHWRKGQNYSHITRYMTLQSLLTVNIFRKEKKMLYHKWYTKLTAATDLPARNKCVFMVWYFHFSENTEISFKVSDFLRRGNTCFISSISDPFRFHEKCLTRNVKTFYICISYNDMPSCFGFLSLSLSFSSANDFLWGILWLKLISCTFLGLSSLADKIQIL